MSAFNLVSPFKPTGDQPQAIRQLTDGVLRGDPAQVLLGVTGSGKTFTMANVIAQVGRPTLILSHNKTLAAQLYREMKAFFHSSDGVGGSEPFGIWNVSVPTTSPLKM